METIELLDTAIKIGLGAFISGFSTYLVTTKNNKHQMTSSLVEKKVTILQSASESLDTYIIKLSDVFSWMDGILRNGTEPGIVTREKLKNLRIREKDTFLVDSREQRSKALSQLKLIGAFKVAEECENLYKIENRYRKKVMFELTIPTESELKEFRDEFKSVKDSIYKAQQAYFEALYI
ncbi:hypothetical protein [Photobacterium leiognathi]|uniref:hypothetical protein n=1 Tax=Photobacterium leiognathi TaxID=553611 RepID=UPI00076A0DBB|nr:hypothetical protein [Photobacterium leiognathi]